MEFMRNLEKQRREVLPLHFWDLKMLTKREKAELRHGEFGELEWDENEDDDDDDEFDREDNEELKQNVSYNLRIHFDCIKILYTLIGFTV